MPRKIIPTALPYDLALTCLNNLYAEHAAASLALRAIPGSGSGPMGLTPDHVRARPDWQAANERYNVAHAAVRSFTPSFMRAHGKRYAVEMSAARAARQAGA